MRASTSAFIGLFVCAGATLADGSGAAKSPIAEPIAASTPPAPGPAERAGAEVDRAMVRVKAWLDRTSESGKAAASEAEAAAKKWFDQTVIDVLGDPKAPLVHGMKIARRLSEETTGAGEAVVHYDWLPVEPRLGSGTGGEKMPARIVLLLHGLDEPGTGWDDLTPHLLRAGYEVVWFDYPNDGPIAASTDIVGEGLKKLRAAGVQRIDIIGHSMGGLVGRDLLTRETWYAGNGAARDGLPAVERLIIMSAPNHGSELAVLEPLAEAREQLSRRFDGISQPGAGLLNSYTDGAGEAGTDLMPGSRFLTELNARPLPTGVAITNIIAVLLSESEQKELAKQTNELVVSFGGESSPKIAEFLSCLSTKLGDGLVSERSAELEGVTDTVRVCADHRCMVRAWKILPEGDAPALTAPETTPAIPVILERLGREVARP